MTNQNIINDISTLLRIPNKTLDELIDKTNLCIGSIISDALTAGETAVIINIGLGTLSVNLTDMQCKFIPSKNLKAAIKNSIDTRIDPVECMLEQTLIEKLTTACTEVF